MCDPTLATLAIAGISAAAQAEAQNEQAEAQNDAARANAESARQNLNLQLDQESIRSEQLRRQNAEQVFAQDRATRREEARVRAGAAERGGTGLSLQAVLGQLQGQQGEAQTALAQQLQATLSDQAFSRIGLGAQATNQTNAVQSVSGADPLATGLNLASGSLQAIKFGNDFNASRSGQNAGLKADIEARSGSV